MSPEVQKWQLSVVLELPLLAEEIHELEPYIQTLPEAQRTQGIDSTWDNISPAK